MATGLVVAAKEKVVLGIDSRKDLLEFDKDKIDRDRLVGIHSPIPVGETSVSAKDLMEVRSDVTKASKEFVSKYGVNPKIVDLMMTIPSGEIRFLSLSELDEFGLRGESPVIQNLERIKLLQECGSELESRRNQFFSEVDSSCPSMKDGFDAAAGCRDEAAIRLRVTREDCKNHGVVLNSELGWIE